MALVLWIKNRNENGLYFFTFWKKYRKVLRNTLEQTAMPIKMLGGIRYEVIMKDVEGRYAGDLHWRQPGPRSGGVAGFSAQAWASEMPRFDGRAQAR
ncbi:hypothetical protein ACQUJS_03405 [Ralstonia pseudosolanacearum]